MENNTNRTKRTAMPYVRHNVDIETTTDSRFLVLCVCGWNLETPTRKEAHDAAVNHDPFYNL